LSDCQVTAQTEEQLSCASFSPKGLALDRSAAVSCVDVGWLVGCREELVGDHHSSSKCKAYSDVQNFSPRVKFFTPSENLQRWRGRFIGFVSFAKE
jgi:hypothetical protein